MDHNSICSRYSRPELTILQSLRTATEGDVVDALEIATAGRWPEDEGELLAVFRSMLDVVCGYDVVEASGSK